MFGNKSGWSNSEQANKDVTYCRLSAVMFYITCFIDVAVHWDCYHMDGAVRNRFRIKHSAEQLWNYISFHHCSQVFSWIMRLISATVFVMILTSSEMFLSLLTFVLTSLCISAICVLTLWSVSSAAGESLQNISETSRRPWLKDRNQSDGWRCSGHEEVRRTTREQVHKRWRELDPRSMVVIKEDMKRICVRREDYQDRETSGCRMGYYVDEYKPSRHEVQLCNAFAFVKGLLTLLKHTVHSWFIFSKWITLVK